MWERTLAGLPQSKDPPVLLWSWLTAFTISTEIKTAKGRADGGVWCQPPETEKPKELEDSCLSSSSRKRGVSTVLTLGWQAALPFCEPGLDIPGAGGMVGGVDLEKGGSLKAGAGPGAGGSGGLSGATPETPERAQIPSLSAFFSQALLCHLLPCGVSLPCHFPKR